MPDGTVEKLVVASFRMAPPPGVLVASPGGRGAACPSRPKLPRVESPAHPSSPDFAGERNGPRASAPSVCLTIHDQLENH